MFCSNSEMQKYCMYVRYCVCVAFLCCRADDKLEATCVSWLVKGLLLLLLLAVLLLIICSVKPGWCRLGLLVDWRLRHLGGSPPV